MRYYYKQDIPNNQPIYASAFQASARKIKPVRNFPPTKGVLQRGVFYKYMSDGTLSERYTYDFRNKDEQYFIYTDNEEECIDGYNNLIKATLYDIEQLKEKYEKLLIGNYKKEECHICENEVFSDMDRLCERCYLKMQEEYREELRKQINKIEKGSTSIWIS